jgi:hypothetical protein
MTSLILPIDSLASFTTVVPMSLLARISLPCCVYHWGSAPGMGLTASGLGLGPGMPLCCASAKGAQANISDKAVAATTGFMMHPHASSNFFPQRMLNRECAWNVRKEHDVLCSLEKFITERSEPYAI